MKHVKKLIKLTNLKSDDLNEKEQNSVTGGNCLCACYYAMCGGSSTGDNDSANSAQNLISLTPGSGIWGYTN